MAKTASLFPEIAGPREVAISAAVADWWDIPVELLDGLWDPLTCPPAVLPHLARAQGMPLWPERWTLSEQRAYTARWIVLSRRIGAVPTFEELLAQVDARLVEFLAPPQGLFPRSPQSPAALAAFRAQYPEIRVYPQRTAHRRPGGFTLGHALPMVLRSSVAGQFGGYRASVVDRGVESPVSVRVTVGAGAFAQGLFEVRLPTKARRLILPAILGSGFTPRRSTAESRVYLYGKGSAPGPDLLPPGTPFELTPKRVREPHELRGGFVVGRALPMVLRKSVAAAHVYDSVRVFDPDRAVQTGPPRRGGWMLGRSKLRQPAFVEHLAVDASYRRPGGFTVGHALPMTLRRHDGARMAEITAAIRAAKLGRDQVLVRTNLFRTIQVGDAIPLNGSVRVGDIIQRL